MFKIKVVMTDKKGKIIHEASVESADASKMQQLYWRIAKLLEQPFNK